MKSHLASLLIALIAGYLGGVSSQFFQAKSIPPEQIQEKHRSEPSSAFYVQTETSELTLQLAQLQERIDWLEMQLNEIANNQSNITDSSEKKTITSTGENTPQVRSLVPDKNNLVSAGVDPVIADDILRRISQQEFRRLELQNLIQRNTGLDIRQYRDELREINQNKISLRAELGDDAYDRYLLESGQNNRMQVTAVMAESPAEVNGIQKGDVILNYNDQKIFNWSDLREVTLEGEIGSFTNVVIYRDGMRMSLIVPRGTLGVQLEAVQLDPALQR